MVVKHMYMYYQKLAETESNRQVVESHAPVQLSFLPSFVPSFFPSFNKTLHGWAWPLSQITGK